MNKKIVSFSALLALSFLVTGCKGDSSVVSEEQPTDIPSTSGPQTEVTESVKPSDSYDSSWTPGEFAISDAVQPEVKNPQGIYNNLGKMRRSQGREGLPQKGEGNLLVVPVEFADDLSNSIAIDESVRDSLNSAFFGEETSDKSLPSVKKYYQQSSYGTLSLDGVVAPTVTLSKEISDYLVTALAQGTNVVISEIIDEVYDALFDNSETYYLPDFDSDDDGRIDGLVLAYSWPAADYFYGTSQYELISSLLVNDVISPKDFVGEAPVASTFFTSSRISQMTNVKNDSHIYIRGVGSLLGIDSYDDVKGNENTGLFRAPLAGLDIMDGNIQDHNPFTKYMMGWINPQVITPSSLNEDLEISLLSSAEASDAVLLAPEDTGLYGEYLLVDFYTPYGLNEVDVEYSYAYNPYGTSRKGLSEAGVRVYKVDSRLVEGKLGDYSMTEEEPDFDKTFVAKDGNTYSYQYDFAFSNDSVNEYQSSGIYETYPLVELLSKRGANRHMVDYTVTFTNEDLFLEGDSFGDENGAYFYQDFRFDGDGYQGSSLDITFEVTSISSSEATLKLRRKAA